MKDTCLLLSADEQCHGFRWAMAMVVIISGVVLAFHSSWYRSASSVYGSLSTLLFTAEAASILVIGVVGSAAVRRLYLEHACTHGAACFGGWGKCSDAPNRKPLGRGLAPSSGEAGEENH